MKYDNELLKLVRLFEARFDIKIGVELEFYVRKNNNTLLTQEELDEFFKVCFDLGVDVCKEKGLFQFEITFPYTSNLIQLIKNIKQTKTLLFDKAKSRGFDILFSPIPFCNDYGSGMHFHLSLYDSNIGSNLFLDERFLITVASGLLGILNSSIYLILGKDPQEYKRIYKAKMVANTVSLGKNNRTTAIRIPYRGDKRLEFRIPSSSCDPACVMFFLLVGILYAIGNKVKKYDIIHGNASDSQYAAERIHNNPYTAKIHYSLPQIYKNLLSNLI